MTKKQDRISIDLKGLRDSIEAGRADPGWKQLSFAGKVRTLILLGLETLAKNQLDQSQSVTISQIVTNEWDTILESDLDLSLMRLKAIRSGGKPSEEEIIVLSTVLSRDAHELMDIKKKTFPCNGEKSNGHPEPAGRL